MAHVLLVEPDTAFVRSLTSLLASVGYTTYHAGTADAALTVSAQEPPDIALIEIDLPNHHGLQLYAQLLARDPQLPAIFITSRCSSAMAIEAMKLGALDYLVKPIPWDTLREVVQQAVTIRRLTLPAATGHLPSPTEPHENPIIGQSVAMQQVYKAIGRVAARNVTVLVRGESGTGKELVARALYDFGGRARGPFMAISCAAIPEPLLESELFGHEKGAFTGADRKRLGKIEQCDGGTLFLDEVGDMSPVLQSKLLRVLQEQTFERVGGNETIRTDTRIIAATNRDLERMVESNQFRGDLYYRLNGFTIHLPPLRDRLEDVPSLVDHFRLSANRDLNKEIHRISPEAMEILMRHDWPGNVRELQSVVRQAILQSAGSVLLVDFLPAWATRRATRPDPSSLGQPSRGPSSLAPSLQGTSVLGMSLLGTSLDEFIDVRLAGTSRNLYDDVIALVEHQLISRILAATAGNQLKAAKRLGITRTTLRAKMAKLGLSVNKLVRTESDVPTT